MAKPKEGPKFYKTTIVARNVGKKVASSKKMVKWGIIYDDMEHFLMLKHSVMSGKKQLYLDDRLIHETKDSFFSSGDFHFDFPLNKHKGHIDVIKDGDGYLYSFYIDDIHYGDLAHLTREEVADMFGGGSKKKNKKTLEFVASGSEDSGSEPSDKSESEKESEEESEEDSEEDKKKKHKKDKKSKKDKKDKSQKKEESKPAPALSKAPEPELDLFGAPSAPAPPPSQPQMQQNMFSAPQQEVDILGFGQPQQQQQPSIDQMLNSIPMNQQNQFGQQRQGAPNPYLNPFGGQMNNMGQPRNPFM